MNINEVISIDLISIYLIIIIYRDNTETLYYICLRSNGLMIKLFFTSYTCTLVILFTIMKIFTEQIVLCFVGVFNTAVF